MSSTQHSLQNSMCRAIPKKAEVVNCLRGRREQIAFKRGFQGIGEGKYKICGQELERQRKFVVNDRVNIKILQ